ncbi:MAG: YraN family protein [Deltaproteobacteria bacterium]|nr:YraN family protein [Deltaproteobacteria bacterium]
MNFTIRNKKFGAWGERMAVHYLQRQGYRILHANWYCRRGELDIVALKEGRVFFFEVKTREERVLESMTDYKFKNMLRSVQLYLKHYGYSFSNFQVDFLGIETKFTPPKLIHIQNILEARI